MSKPQINVTPLIDVLLVLLIIFMVVTPMKPSSFETKIPREPDQKEPGKIHPHAIVVTIRSDATLQLNQDDADATVAEPEALTRRLSVIFEERRRNQVLAETVDGIAGRIEKTVFLKAPRSLNYGSVARVVDALKLAGAEPVSLQIDRLE